jgi:hypothetical protein
MSTWIPKVHLSPTAATKFYSPPNSSRIFIFLKRIYRPPSLLRKSRRRKLG